MRASEAGWSLRCEEVDGTLTMSLVASSATEDEEGDQGPATRRARELLARPIPDCPESPRVVEKISAASRGRTGGAQDRDRAEGRRM